MRRRLMRHLTSGFVFGHISYDTRVRVVCSMDVFWLVGLGWVMQFNDVFYCFSRSTISCLAGCFAYFVLYLLSWDVMGKLLIEKERG